MDLYQLKTFVAVAREGTITRAAEVVHLSQPAVSAHIKEIEETLGLTLFERTSRGMGLTADGRRLLARAEQTLAAHQALLEEAARSKGQLHGKLRLGAGSNSDHQAIGRLLTTMSERHPEVEVTLRHARSAEILAGLRNDTFDAGFYNEGAAPDRDLATLEVSRFKVFLAAAKGSVPKPLDWKALSTAAWIYPPAAACCGRAAEAFFESHHIRPAPHIAHAVAVGVEEHHGPAARGDKIRAIHSCLVQQALVVAGDARGDEIHAGQRAQGLQAGHRAQ
jgi:DNA-binding transcriptional LysR family regulator